MRDYKFRAWYKKGKKWCSDWSISSYEEILNLVKEMDYQNIILMQYSGLKDKNSKEVCEDDVILMFGWWKSVVRWEDGMFIFTGEDGERYPLAKAIGPIEIIGNIWENPELMNAIE